MVSRQAIFGITNEQGNDNEKLVELFKNRAELKKEFAALRKEKYRLQKLVKEQQGATARITQRLEHLESLLVDPEWVHTIVVFYQLRSLNRRCESKLAKFAEQLKQQRENRRRDIQLQGWGDKLKSKKTALEQKLVDHREQSATARRPTGGREAASRIDARARKNLQAAYGIRSPCRVQ